MSGSAPRIANYVVTRLLEVSLSDADAPASRYATTIFLDMITAFPNAEADEFRQGVAMTKALVQWQGSKHDQMIVLLTEAVASLFRR